ncbi:cryptochrome/photolyase family protein [Rubritalea tangerina]|uniref:Cryptochrome/photolyase family protein n=1 Tax=Rubritalea tangerina TaxID=430798 RepID=A0ABW4Z5N0_9BACT
MIEAADQVYLIDDVWLYEGRGRWKIRPHRKRLLHLKASVFAYLERCQRSGIHVESLLHPSDIAEAALRGSECVVCRLNDAYLEDELEEAIGGGEITWLESPGFVTPHAWGEDFFADGKKPFMKTFYEAQRKRMGVLLGADGKPVGGRWSFDEDNRKKLPRKVAVPSAPMIEHDEEGLGLLERARESLVESGQWADGSGDGENLRYPITHAGAERWLEQFLVERFSGFGSYEDALSTRGDFLYHSVLTPMLNIGLLTPQQVVDAALAHAGRVDVAMNDLEGFIRQVIGWREFIAILYRKHGGWMRRQNFFGFVDAMPKSIWKGRTGLEPVDYVLDKVQREGYAHHIERLMVMGNFFMLMRIRPDDVYRWFMEMFVDAYDWVMVPNVYGMSQYASGGFMVTKPYLSGSNYLKKMSDFKAGPWCDVWDALYWSFIDDHRDFFASQYRMKMMLGHLERMGADKLAGHHALAKEFRVAMHDGQIWGEASLF